MNGTERGRFVARNSDNREQLLPLGSDVGLCGGGHLLWGEVASVSISLLPSSSQPGPVRLLCSLMDFYPAHSQLSCFQGQQQLSGHGVGTAVVPNGDWSQQLLVLLETSPRRGVTSSCQVEHVSLEQPLSLALGHGGGAGGELGEALDVLGGTGGSWREPGFN
ncbi:hypothetical protein DUI87_06211 [Hirundo rustica rustica]|uniref:Immunoglobulin C1-set domain-containing protein n=1 Tax=Hirundo rustica rustica TaxID=333673 RepID=A0A3M0KVM4_HIRRU|nr:hypothetical protein DUI87_06211 [Hirundo rustica rustica]